MEMAAICAAGGATGTSAVRSARASVDSAACQRTQVSPIYPSSGSTQALRTARYQHPVSLLA